MPTREPIVKAPLEFVPRVLAAGEIRNVVRRSSFLFLYAATDSTAVQISFDGSTFVALPLGFTLQDFITLLSLLNKPRNFKEWRQRSKLTYQGLRRAGLSPSERRIIVNFMRNARRALLKQNVNPAEALAGLEEQRNTS